MLIYLHKMKMVAHKNMIGIIVVLFLAFWAPSLAQATLSEKEFSLKPYFENQNFKILNYPCKVKEVEATPTCLIEENDRIYLNNKNFDAFFSEKGFHFIVVNNEKALKLWGVNLYEDVVPEESPLFSYNSMATYLKDDDGLSRFRACVSKTLYPLFDPTSRDAQGALAKQWLCLRQNNLQKVLFLSPDFFFLPQSTQQDILQSSKNTNLVSSPVPLSSQSASPLYFPWLPAGIVLLSIGTIFWGLLFKESIQQFIKRISLHLTRNLAFFFFLSPLFVGLLYAIQLRIPLKAFVFYLILYFLASALLMGLSPSIRHKWTILSQQCQLYDQKTHGKLRTKIQYIVAICGILWLYSFFLFSTWQLLPLMGFFLGTAGLIFMGVKVRDFLDCDVQVTPWFLYALKLLPLVLLIGMAVRYALLPKQFVWQSNDFERAQDVQLYTLDNAPLKGLASSDGVLLNGPTLLSFTVPRLPLGFDKRQALLSLTLKSDEVLDLKPYNFNLRYYDPLFYLPRFDELFLLHRSPKEELALYSTNNRTKTFPIEPLKTIRNVIQENLREDDVVSDLSQGTPLYLMKPSFGLFTNSEDLKNTNATTWDIPLWGGKPYDIYLEVDQDTLSFEFDVSRLQERAVGAELLNVTLMSSDGVIVAFDQKTISYPLNNQRTETFRFEKNNLTDGLYRLTLQPVILGTYLNPKVTSTYRIDAMRSSSPVMMLYADKLAVAEMGTVFTRVLGDEVYLEADAEKKLIPSKKELQSISFSEHGGTLVSDEKLLFSQSEELWISPFYALPTNSLKKLTDYLIVESNLFDQTTRSSEGTSTFSRIFTIPANQEKIQWLLTPHDMQKNSFTFLLQNITIQLL